MTSGKAEYSSFTDFTNEPIYLYLQCFIFLTVDFILQFHIICPQWSYPKQLQMWHLHITPAKKRKTPTIKYKLLFQFSWSRMDHIPNSEPITRATAMRY